MGDPRCIRYSHADQNASEADKPPFLGIGFGNWERRAKRQRFQRVNGQRLTVYFSPLFEREESVGLVSLGLLPFGEWRANATVFSRLLSRGDGLLRRVLRSSPSGHRCASTVSFLVSFAP
jgi:hypothetical protein